MSLIAKRHKLLKNKLDVDSVQPTLENDKIIGLKEIKRHIVFRDTADHGMTFMGCLG